MPLNPLAVHDAAAHDLWIALAIAWLALELVTQRLRREARPKRFDWSYLAVVVTTIVAFNVGYRLARDGDGIFGGGWAPVVVGLLILGAGVAFRFWAISVLGRFFTSQVTTQPGQRVVRAGPYRYLRHPSYTGALVALIGLGLALDGWPALLALVLVPLAGLLVRIRVEERALESALGDEYRQYARETPRLVPGIW